MTPGLAVEDGVGTVTIRGVGRHNALDLDGLRRLCDVVAEADRDPAVRVILLRADGDAFCVGASADFLGAGDRDIHDEILRVGEVLGPTVRRLHETPKITVAAIHGAVAGGGFGLMAAADVIFAAESTILTLGFELLATNPDAGATWFLPRDIGYRRALALYLTSERLDARRARELGLVTEVVADAELATRSAAFACAVAAGSAHAHAVTKRLLRQAGDTPLARQLDDEILAFADNTRRPEFEQGVGALVTRLSGRSDAGP